MLTIQAAAIPTKTVRVPFSSSMEGFEVEIAFVSRSVSEQLIKSCTTEKVGETGDTIKSLDRDLFSTKFAEHAIRGWTGLTWEYVAQLVLLDESQIEDMDAEVPFSVENAAYLVKQSPAFDGWVNKEVYTLASFRSRTDS